MGGGEDWFPRPPLIGWWVARPPLLSSYPPIPQPFLSILSMDLSPPSDILSTAGGDHTEYTEEGAPTGHFSVHRRFCYGQEGLR